MFDSGFMYLSSMVTDCIYQNKMYEASSDSMMLTDFFVGDYQPGFQIFPDGVYLAGMLTQAVNVYEGFMATEKAGVIETLRFLRYFVVFSHMVAFEK